MTNSVTLLGTKGGPAIRPGTPMPTSMLVEMDGQRLLVDAGLGVTRGVCDAGVALTELDAILITHLHSDHYLELGPLLHTAWTAGLKKPLTVWGPDGLAHYWEKFLDSMAFDIELRVRDEGRPDLASLVTIERLAQGCFSFNGLLIETMLNVHPPIEESYALKISGSHHRVVLSGDTAPMEAMVTFAKGADLLVHEAMLTAGIEALCARVGNGDDRLRIHLERSHSAAGEVAKIAAAAGVKRLALNHLIPSDDPDFGPEDWKCEVSAHWNGPWDLGVDNMRIELE
ncbi:MBL fold metallo-hydrolase [Cohaesibacter sp. CAU 1516]|uniref:MBL fold metallo-hydrolase n=1 Tax=Cohaesibacter sp. CAU 1516 TaxID=2576038 RepID=UPI0010FD28E6|nr:MBL fold metallo-hydrolase [Cohaesibacter sp. CAU 1516]TLP48271.1 MBL fold metallo-hydrolase [Cohaesibacter sp. CAU 1516]